MLKTRIIIPVLLALILVSCGRQSADVDTPQELVEAMYARYEGKWYKTLTFKQETVQYRGLNFVADTSIWYEALALPGKLRIDIAPVESGNGLLFVDDRRHVFRGDTLLLERDEINPLMLLAFDAYTQPADVTLAKLDSLGVDLSVLHETEWKERPTYVVGAAPGDLRTRQFWIDKEHLYLVRMIHPDGPNRQNIVDIRFSEFIPLAGGWVGRVIEFFLDGRISLLEVYLDIQAGQDLNPNLFEPGAWAEVEHWMETENAPANAGP
ncbi:MAG: hypothetical protein R3178_02220 [Rhodothermales bacterium]|nr:hypothetical protein [Rhodothermales bacterium]